MLSRNKFSGAQQNSKSAEQPYLTFAYLFCLGKVFLLERAAAAESPNLPGNPSRLWTSKPSQVQQKTQIEREIVNFFVIAFFRIGVSIMK